MGYYTSSSSSCTKCRGYSVLIEKCLSTCVTIGAAILLGLFIYFCYSSPIGRKLVRRLGLVDFATRMGFLTFAQQAADVAGQNQDQMLQSAASHGDISDSVGGPPDLGSTSAAQAIMNLGKVIFGKVPRRGWQSSEQPGYPVGLGVCVWTGLGLSQITTPDLTDPTRGT